MEYQQSSADFDANLYHLVKESIYNITRITKRAVRSKKVSQMEDDFVKLQFSLGPGSFMTTSRRVNKILIPFFTF